VNKDYQLKPGQTDRRTDGRQTVALRFPLDAASVKIYVANDGYSCSSFLLFCL